MFTNDMLLDEMDGLRKFAFKLTRSQADAEDLTQNTILRALEKRHLFRKDSSVFKWSCKIMYNLFVSAYRRKRKFETQYDPESYIESFSVDPAQDTALELKEVTAAMDELSAEHKEVLVMVCIKEMAYEDVAKHLKIPVGTVRSRLSRARGNLTKAINHIKPNFHTNDNALYAPELAEARVAYA
ncbi:MAG: RNA polymerase subunit sigma-24 [Micavibrio sp.]|nr:RNA polymerase subunit sigma-24 [Micavibrio sp.]|tara:strand:- start:2697 stop:3248 length:552 start_codon:yes stop_codon:yes gene_type:complete